LHAKASIAYRVAESSAEIDDVLAKMRDALQQVPPPCVFSAIVSGSTPYFFTLKDNHARVGYYFSTKATAIIHRRYMS
jgi:hypothetical protein